VCFCGSRDRVEEPWGDPGDVVPTDCLDDCVELRDDPDPGGGVGDVADNRDNWELLDIY
jgi:hypothetical protein